MAQDSQPQLKTKEVLWDWYTSLSSSLRGAPTQSSFLTTGSITPDEFVAAGDLLVDKCGSWSWAAGDSSKKINGLPDGKQFLITRNVPCNPTMREQAKSEVVDDDWLSMASPEEESVQGIVDVKDSSANDNNEDDDEDDDADVPDAHSFEGEGNLVEEEEDPALQQNLVQRTRTYDVTICYDMYHHVPHVWLVGYDKTGHPLKPAQMYEDISKDHVGETVTIKPHPHLGLPYASIHPCRHADVMKKIVKNMQRAGREPRSDLYLFIFLKFLSAVIPSIEYDNTFDLDISLRSEEPETSK